MEFLNIVANVSTDLYKAKDQSESHLSDKKTNMLEAKILLLPKLRKTLLV